MSEKHFIEQQRHAESYLIPYFKRHCPGFLSFSVLEVGCAEGGLLDALQKRGIRSSGLELEPHRAALAKTLNPSLDVRVGDLTDPSAVAGLGRLFDLVVMRDVIEHIPHKETAFRHLRSLLKPDGYLYVTFPPRFSPFAGHHQNGRTCLRRIPYLHLLPASWLRTVGRLAGEHAHVLENAAANFKIGLSIHRFEALAASYGFEAVVNELYWIRPVFRIRMGLRPRRAPNWPGLREVFSLGCECLLRLRD